MKKIIFIVFVFVFSFYSAKADTFKGKVEYNENTARVEAFLNADKKIDKSIYKDFLKDKNRKQNLKLLSDDIFKTENRELCPFYAQKNLVAYAISYYDKPNYTFYYNYFGQLIKFEIIKQDSYPRQSLGYSRFGNLISAAFEIDENEQFLYSAKGEFLAHWLGDELVSSNNKISNFLKIKRSK